MAIANSVKVSREALIKKLKARKAAIEVLNSEHKLAYDQAMPQYRKAMIEVLESALRGLKANGRLLENNYKEIRIPFSYEDKPYMAQQDTRAIERDISILEMSVEDQITVRTDSNWAAYL